MIVGIDNTTFPDQIVPITKDLACAFLAEDFMCKIYNDRPECCRRFGEVAELKCPHEL